MLKRWSIYILGLLAGLLLTDAVVPVFAYDNYVLDNLRRSRDALLSQQAELKTAYDDTQRQIAVLQQKLTRIDGYLNQIDLSLRDVNHAIDQAN